MAVIIGWKKARITEEVSLVNEVKFDGIICNPTRL